MGVLGSPYRKQLLPILEARLVAPDQPIWDRYLDTLVRLSELVSPGSPRTRQEYVTRLIASLPAKEPGARVVSMNTLVDSAGREGPGTAWLPAVAASIVTDFRTLPFRMQLNLLAGRWNIIGGPDMLPVLR